MPRQRSTEADSSTKPSSPGGAMRRPRFRIRLWWLMIVVAVCGILIGGETMRRRRAGYLRKAQSYAAIESGARSSITAWEQSYEECQQLAAKSQRLAAESQRLAAEIQELLREYGANPIFREQLSANLQ